MQCPRLFRAEKIHVFYAEGHVVVAADVWMNPVADVVRICPNPIAPPVGPKEFLVEGTTKPGIHPALLVKHRVTYSYPSDTPPKSVIVYTMGIDAPVRGDVHPGTPPPPLAPGDSPSPEAARKPGPAAAPATGPVEVTGFSSSFSIEEALQDALIQAAAKFPSPPRNPDVAVTVEVIKIFARTGGNIRPGVYIKANAK